PPVRAPIRSATMRLKAHTFVTALRSISLTLVREVGAVNGVSRNRRPSDRVLLAVRVRMILPALTEATSPFFRPIKYSLFPPLGLATLAGYLDDSDDVVLSDEHVEKLVLDDEPDLVVIQVYITSARRAYEIADLYRSRGSHVALGGLHVTSLPEEAARHADTIFLGPGEDTRPQGLADVLPGRAARRAASEEPTLVADLRDPP